jgi:hypothetical protein
MDEVSANSESRPVVPAGTVFASAAGITAAWLAADSMGLLAEPLRIALTYLALLLAIVVAWPRRPLRWWWIVAGVLVACLPALTTVTASPVPALHELLVVTAVMALLAAGAEGPQRTALSSCAHAALGLSVFRLACSSVPLVWTMANWLGGWLGRFAGWISGEPLNIGATFAGLDFLVLMATLYVAWLAKTERPRVRRAVVAACAIVTGHLLYLVLLAHALDLAAMLPTVADPTFDHPYIPPDWRWSAALAQLLPWNLPAAAAAIHVSIACLMLRWAPWRLERDDHADISDEACRDMPAWRRWSLVLSVVLAAVLPVSSHLAVQESSLSDKTIVANMQGRLDWQRPEYDQYGQQSAGMFGMLPSLIESLGGQLRLSQELSERDLADADVLLLLHPSGPLPEPIRTRIWDYVRRGGSLLLVAEPYLQEDGVYSISNDLLEPTSMTVRRDVAISETGRWQQACLLMAHPTTHGIDPRRGDHFPDAGSSIELGLTARPLVVGRWGWSDPGSAAVLTGAYALEPGERLGDVVLAAEQRFGDGTIIVLGNGHCLTNEGSVCGYTLAGRLLAFLAGRRSSPASPWRQLASLVLCLGLLALVGRGSIPTQLSFIALLLALSLTATELFSSHETRVVPDGRIASTEALGARSNLAYIDASHLEAYSDAPWVFDGVNGLALTLMRNGFLTTALPELTSERLQCAALLVSVAPARSFSAEERKIVRQYVEEGGVFICTVGAEEAAASQSLLEQFGIRVPVSPVPTGGNWREPEPIGRMRSLFLDANEYGMGDYRVGVLFYAVWPVEAEGSGVEILVRAADDQPVVVSRRVGSGRVVVIGDTGFAMNKNLEYVGGEPFEGNYENAHFWRWLITRVTDRPEWVPPPAQPAPVDGAGQEAQP